MRAIQRIEDREERGARVGRLTMTDWIKLSRRHGRSLLAVQQRAHIIRAAVRIAHGLTR